MKTSWLDTYLGQGTRLESSRKKPKRCMKKWTKKELKIDQERFDPVRGRCCTGRDGMFTPDGRGEVPSGIRYLGNKFEVPRNSIKKKSRPGWSCTGRSDDLHRTKWRVSRPGWNQQKVLSLSQNSIFCFAPSGRVRAPDGDVTQFIQFYLVIFSPIWGFIS